MFQILFRSASQILTQTLDSARAWLLFVTMHAIWAHCLLSVTKAAAYAALTAVLMRGKHHPVPAYCALTAVLILDATVDILVLALVHGGGGS
jgi:hypothetical protein